MGQRIGKAAASLRLARFASDERLVALVRGGGEDERAAFEALYDRYARELLAFCTYTLGSREDAEDAVQATFSSAYSALLADERSIDVRPWLFTIARNASLTILRKRRPAVEILDRASREELVAHVEKRESVRQMLDAVLALPERQRTALVLAELHGHSHSEIGEVLGVRAEQVKAYVYQARSSLISELSARSAACEEIRAELVGASGAALLRGRLRRHLRSCADCREFARQESLRRRELGALLPIGSMLALKRRVLHATIGESARTGAGAAVGGASAAGGSSSLGGVSLSGVSAELGGAGAKALVAKALIVLATAGAGTTAGTVAVGLASSQPARRSTAVTNAVATRRPLAGASTHVTVPAVPAPAAPAHAPGGTGLLADAGAGARGAVAASGRAQPPRSPDGTARTSGADAAHASAASNNDAAHHGNGGAEAHSGAGAHGRSETHSSSAAHGNSGSHGSSDSHGGSNGHGSAGSRGNSSAHGNSGTNRSSGAHGNSSGAGAAVAGGLGAAHAHGGGPAASHVNSNGSGGSPGNGGAGAPAAPAAAPPGGSAASHDEAQGHGHGQAGSPPERPAAEVEPRDGESAHAPRTGEAPGASSGHGRGGG